MKSISNFKRTGSIADSMPEALWQSRYQMKRCFARYVAKGKRLMKNQQLMEELEQSMDDRIEKTRLMEGFLGHIICSTQEATVLPPFVAFAVRANPGIWEFVKVNSMDLEVESFSAGEYLKFKEMMFNEQWAKKRKCFGGGFWSI